MNTHEIYIPIDVRGPINANRNINIQQYDNANTVLFFQLFDKCKPVMLTDTTSLSIAFTGSNSTEHIKGSGLLQIVNPYRGTISYELHNNDIQTYGLNTITLGITTNDSFFTIQCAIMCQTVSDDLYNTLTGNGNSSGCCGNCSNCTCCEFPCKYFSIYCRSCRRCKFAFYHNNYPKPVDFNKIKVCHCPPVPKYFPDYSKDNNYELCEIPMAFTKEGYLLLVINDTEYTCDIGTHGDIYLLDKTIQLSELQGLYIGRDNRLYYNKTEKVNTDSTSLTNIATSNDIKSLF